MKGKKEFPMCNEHFEINEMEGDHITPGLRRKTNANCQMLCKDVTEENLQNRKGRLEK